MPWGQQGSRPVFGQTTVRPYSDWWPSLRWTFLCFLPKKVFFLMLHISFTWLYLLSISSCCVLQWAKENMQHFFFKVNYNAIKIKKLHFHCSHLVLEGDPWKVSSTMSLLSSPPNFHILLIVSHWFLQVTWYFSQLLVSNFFKPLKNRKNLYQFEMTIKRWKDLWSILYFFFLSPVLSVFKSVEFQVGFLLVMPFMLKLNKLLHCF